MDGEDEDDEPSAQGDGDLERQTGGGRSTFLDSPSAAVAFFLTRPSTERSRPLDAARLRTPVSPAARPAFAASSPDARSPPPSA